MERLRSRTIVRRWRTAHPIEVAGISPQLFDAGGSTRPVKFVRFAVRSPADTRANEGNPYFTVADADESAPIVRIEISLIVPRREMKSGPPM